MIRITTKTGDEGMTSLHGGSRVSKTHPRIEANGTLDELNALLGVCRAFIPVNDRRNQDLKQLQTSLMGIMSHIATPEDTNNPRKHDAEERTLWMEAEIERITTELNLKRHFVVPGGNLIAAHLQWARTVCRRAERQLWALHQIHPVNPQFLRMVNRMSDYLFLLAVSEMEQLQKQGNESAE